MTSTAIPIVQPDDTSPVAKVLSPAAQRALAEAAARRAARDPGATSLEHDGPKGVEPTRFGDWERKGIAYDF